MRKQIGLCILLAVVVLCSFGCRKKGQTSAENTDYSEYMTLCDYTGIPATRVLYSVQDDEVSWQVSQDMYAYVTYDTVTNRAAKSGDYVNIDYEGVLEGQTNSSYHPDYTDKARDLLLGENVFFPEAEREIIGMYSGDTKIIEVKLDEDHAVREEDVGKMLTLNVTLNEISVECLPEYTDEFAREQLGCDSTQEYEAVVRERLMEEKAERYRDLAVDEIMDYLRSNCTFDVFPQALYDACRDEFTKSNEARAEEYGMSLDEYLALFDMDEEGIEQAVVEDVNTHMIVYSVANAQGIVCDEEEVNACYREQYVDYGYESEEAFRDSCKEQQLRYRILYDKVTEYLYEKADFTEIDEEEYEEASAES